MKNKVLGVLFVIAFIILQFIVTIYSNFYKIETIDVVIPLIILTFVLIFSGRLSEVTWPGGISFKLKQEGQKDVINLVRKYSEESFEPLPEFEIAKGEIIELPDGAKLILSFEIGRTDYYHRDDIQRYIRFLEEKFVIDKILFKGHKGKFKGVIDIINFKNHVQLDENIVQKIETGNILAIPNMITFSITEDTTVREAVEIMDRHNKPIAPVVDRYDTYVGVVELDEILKKMFLKISS